MTPQFWRNKRVLITGHSGFKGAWLSLWLHRLGAVVTGYSLLPPSDPSLFELTQLARSMNSIEGDVRDAGTVVAIVKDCRPEIIFHLAAQSLVRRSYSDPSDTFTTNLIGTVNILDACRNQESVRAVVIVTSDKCYEETGGYRAYREDDPLGGHDPYSASKACAEIISAAYRRSYFSRFEGPHVATARAGNVIGGGDWANDRIVPDLVRAFSKGREARIRNPGATRPWQHVLDPLFGYLVLAERLCGDGASYAGAWNFGPGIEESPTTVEQLVQRAAMLWGAGAQWKIDANGGHAREAPSLQLDAGKSRARLRWKPRLDVQQALSWTIAWYREWHDGAAARALTEKQIGQYMAEAA